MAFYTSYKQGQMETGLRPKERAPLSLINGNQKLPRAKDELETNQYFSTYEPSVLKANPVQSFSIFSDNDESYNVKVKEEKQPEKPAFRLFNEDNNENLDIENFPPPPPPLFEGSLENEAIDYLCHDSPYKDDNFMHLRRIEQKYKPNSKYMSLQMDINSNMRAILVDWLVDVGIQFEFSSEAVHLAVSLTDRFLSCTTVTKGKLQLVGIACLFITAKYEEVNAQELKMYAWITDNTYTKKHILRMEQIIMDRLHFYVGGPTALSFMSLVYSLTRSPKKLLYLGQYLCELALLDNEPFLSFLPSLLGVAAYCLARYILGYIMWIDELNMTGYTLDDLKPAINSLFNKARDVAGKSAGSISEKYSHPNFLRVAEIELPEILIICN
ncbi:cyclin-A1 [Parasteatoda tepidariorum]|uniref:cyclin-A1 n=1 Tax=Parasteatoda tepidariorum TaxID=114398 RepID=UPI00077F8693|nr:cyclin-A1 [Parasteatoda tepidariorum]